MLGLRAHAFELGNRDGGPCGLGGLPPDARDLALCLPFQVEQERFDGHQLTHRPAA